MNKAFLSTAVLTLILAHSVSATESEIDMNNEIRFSGFYSFSATHYDAPKPFLRDLTYMTFPQTERTSVMTDSRVGLQVEAPITNQLSGTVQLLGANHIDYGDGDGVQWAFLRYHANDNTTVRIGRLGIDMFMLSDYRNVSYAYPWVRPVQDYYGFLPLFYFDGGDIAWQRPFDIGSLRLKFNAGTIQASFNGSRLHMRNFMGGDVEWQADNWRLRAAYASMKFANNPDYGPASTILNNIAPYWPDANQLNYAIGLYNRRVHFASIGGELEQNNWWGQAEIGRVSMGEASLFGNVIAGYISGGYRFGAWLPYITLSRAHSKQNYFTTSELPSFLSHINPGLPTLRSTLTDAVNQLYSRQKTISLGVRWDFHPQTALKLQWDNIHAQPMGQGLWGGCNACSTDTLRGQVITLSIDGTF